MIDGLPLAGEYQFLHCRKAQVQNVFYGALPVAQFQKRTGRAGQVQGMTQGRSQVSLVFHLAAGKTR